MKRHLCLAALLLMGCSKVPPPAATATPASAYVLGIEAAQVVRQSISPKVAVTGSVVADRRVDLASSASGLVESVSVELGQFVSQGQVLVRLRPAEVERQTRLSQAQYLERAYQSGVLSPKGSLRQPADVPSIRKAKGNLEYYKRHYESYLELRKDELISDQQVTDALHDYTNAKADYEASMESYHQAVAQVKMGQVEVDVERSKGVDYVVKSPFDGYVQERKVSVGSYASQGQPLGLVLVSASPLFAELEVPQQYAGQLRLGQAVELTCDAYPGKTLRAHVERVSPDADPATRTLAVQARLQDMPRWLKPGMFVKAGLQVEAPREQMLVPDASVLTLQGKSHVFVLKPQGEQWVARRLPVEVGKSSDDWVEVKGLSALERVAASDLTSLEDGSLVKISKEIRQTP